MEQLERGLESNMEKEKILEKGIEPSTSAVLRPRHNQLDHPSADTNLTYCIQYLSNTKKTSSTTD